VLNPNPPRLVTVEARQGAPVSGHDERAEREDDQQDDAGH
jgi:hypothetical protein